MHLISNPILNMIYLVLGLGLLNTCTILILYFEYVKVFKKTISLSYPESLSLIWIPAEKDDPFELNDWFRVDRRHDDLTCAAQPIGIQELFEAERVLWPKLSI